MKKKKKTVLEMLLISYYSKETALKIYLCDDKETTVCEEFRNSYAL